MGGKSRRPLFEISRPLIGVVPKATPKRSRGRPDGNRLQALAEKRWAKTDKVLLQLSRDNSLGPGPADWTSDGFSTLVRSIVHQQVSMASGRAILNKVVKTLGGKITPRRVLNRSPEQLRGAGLSRGKVAYIRDLADKTLRGEVEFSRFPDLTDEAIMNELTAVKGIGDWTAKMFLMFHLERPDVLPHEDLGLRLAVQEAYGIPVEHAAKFMQKQQVAWTPYCTMASRILWQSRHAVEEAPKS